MSWKDGFYAALLEFVKKNLDVSAAEVTGFKEEEEIRGYCETCSYSTIVVKIDYKNTDGRHCWKEYEGNFADLIRELSDNPAQDGHNHVSTVIKTDGSCPACNDYLEKEGK